MISLLLALELTERDESLWLRIVLGRQRRIAAEQRIHISNYCSIVERFPDIQFREDFRMPRTMFQVKCTVTVNVVYNLCI